MSMIEKRQFGRRESAIHAVAMFGGRTAHCIVRNFSEGGALLEFNDSVTPPFRFRLIIEAKNVDVECEVRHQGKHGVGVSFGDGCASGLLNNQPATAKPVEVREPAVEAPSRPAVNGATLRSAMFGIEQKPQAPKAARVFNAEAGGIIRGSLRA